MGIELDDDSTAIVIDSGSLNTRSGFAGDDAPRSYMPTVVGRHEYNNWMVGMDGRDSYIGPEAQNKHGLLSLNYPVDRGCVRDWDDWENVMTYIFTKELRVEPSDYPVLMSDPPRNAHKNREITTESMFERFNVPGFYLAMQPLLTMYASGRGTAIMVECGHSVSHIAAVYEGYCIKSATRRIPFAGCHVTDYLARKLNDRGNCFTSLPEMEDVTNIKQRHCYVASDYQQELKSLANHNGHEKRYELPDGRIISVGQERFSCMEGLFRPEMFNIESVGIQDHVYESLMQCDMDTRRDMFANVLISGASTLAPGFPQRLKEELSCLFPRRRIHIVAPPERKLLTWIGGSILASLSTFQSQWITKSEYEETGPCVVHTKCIDL